MTIDLSSRDLRGAFFADAKNVETIFVERAKTRGAIGI